MAKYLVSVSYTAEGAKGLAQDGGTKRVQVVTAFLKAAGVTVESFYFALGEHDAFIIADAPDHVSVTAVALAVNGSGAARLSTTVLLTPAEVDAATKKSVNYPPPGRA
jgi:uncharacterized protein with GYD domain